MAPLCLSMRSLTILFTNNTLAERAGSELWVRDVTRALLDRGHRPIAFSLVMGAIAAEMRAATIPVVDDLENVGMPPDVIHGHHHVETLIAALHFPGVPIVQVCHGWVPWEERPLKHPAIVKYLAVDDPTYDRLIVEEGIVPDRVEILRNFVDLSRFGARGPLPERPRRALVFSNGASPDRYATVIREACGRTGIQVEIGGLRCGRPIASPESILRDFDLVFAKARSALEALAVGCGVILADAAGCGPLVTTREFDRLRAWNFGIRALQHPHSVEWYARQLAAFDAADAASVSARVRAEAGLDAAVERLLAVYEGVVQSASAEPARRSPEAAQRAAARHLAWLAREFKTAQHARERLAASCDEQCARANAAEAALASQQLRLATLEQEVQAYRSLSTIRLRDRVLRVPFVGGAVRRAARALTASRD